MKRLLLGACASLLLSLGGWMSVVSGAEPESVAVASDEWLTQAETVLARVDSYTARFHKRERIDDTLLPDEVVRLLFKRPFKVRLQWTEGPLKGRDVIYAEGWNGNRVRVHEKGFLGILPLNLDPQGSLAMKNNRHSIVESGLGQLVERIAQNLRRGRAAGELQVRERGLEMLYGRRVKVMEGVLPKDPTKRYYCHRALLFVDTERRVPIRVQIHDTNDVLVEDYGFEDLVLDAGLTDQALGIAD
jgi:hypothetical protein